MIARTERLRAELPRMLEGHETTAARLEDLRRAAKDEGEAEYARLAEDLVLHPSALMIGEYVRLRSDMHSDQGQDR